ncbi:MAG TPA: hypothetical protein VGO74_09085 [Modestobacter sp.]|nr:hypothetical protein [Modestobacter sp.]
MPRTRKDEAPVQIDDPQIESRAVDLGDHTVMFQTYRADVDPAPLFRGLPDDRCQCPHWGLVLSGRLTIHHADHDETFTAGDAYTIAPGHTPEVFAGTEIVEFSPTAALEPTMSVLAANMAAAQEPVR